MVVFNRESWYLKMEVKNLNGFYFSELYSLIYDEIYNISDEKFKTEYYLFIDNSIEEAQDDDLDTIYLDNASPKVLEILNIAKEKFEQKYNIKIEWDTKK